MELNSALHHSLISTSRLTQLIIQMIKTIKICLYLHNSTLLTRPLRAQECLSAPNGDKSRIAQWGCLLCHHSISRPCTETKASAEAITARCLRAALRRLINIQSQLFRRTSSFQTGLLDDSKARSAAAHRKWQSFNRGKVTNLAVSISACWVVWTRQVEDILVSLLMQCGKLTRTPPTPPGTWD